MEDIYPISEDTLLMLKNIECKGKILEMGTGNGEIAIYCAEKGCDVTAVDIDPDALNYVKKRAASKKLNIKVIQSNLFENINEKYDMIIFNPPYLPGDPKNLKDLQWAGGGKYGDETIINFLKNAKKYLKKNGKIYLIVSSFNRIEYIKNYKEYNFKLVDTMKFSFHEIYLFELRKNLKE